MTYLLYVNVARRLVNIAPYYGGCLGSGWMVAGTKVSAMEIMEQMLGEGYERGHLSAPTY